MADQIGSYKDSLSLVNKLARAAWIVFAAVFFRPFSGPIFRYYRSCVLRLWGAKVGKCCAIAAGARIWAPWNLTVGDYVAIANNVDVYDVAPIKMGDHITISQDSFLCTASHDITSRLKPLIYKPITIDSFAWVCARAVILPGISVGEGAVISCAAVVSRVVVPWTVVGGNPARFIKVRDLKSDDFIMGRHTAWRSL